jgi:hypothetical protein
MSSLTSDLLISPQDLYDITVSSLTPVGSTSGINNDAAKLGALATTGDGRYFRYSTAGAVALVPGTLQQASAEVTGSQNLGVAAAAIGATSVTTTSNVTCAANDFAGGYLIVTVTPGQGYQYQIVSHAAASSAPVTLNLADPIVVALTTSSKIDLVANPYKGVVINPTTATSCPVGVAVAATPISYYGWLQVRGVSAVLADGTVTVGTELVASNGTAGAVEALTGVQAIVGTAVTGIATTEYGAVNLKLA